MVCGPSYDSLDTFAGIPLVYNDINLVYESPPFETIPLGIISYRFSRDRVPYVRLCKQSAFQGSALRRAASLPSRTSPERPTPTLARSSPPTSPISAFHILGGHKQRWLLQQQGIFPTASRPRPQQPQERKTPVHPPHPAPKPNPNLSPNPQHNPHPRPSLTAHQTPQPMAPTPRPPSKTTASANAPATPASSTSSSPTWA